MFAGHLPSAVAGARGVSSASRSPWSVGRDPSVLLGLASPPGTEGLGVLPGFEGTPALRPGPAMFSPASAVFRNVTFSFDVYTLHSVQILLLRGEETEPSPCDEGPRSPWTSLSAFIGSSKAVAGCWGRASSYVKSSVPRRGRPGSPGRGALADGLPVCAPGRPRRPGLHVAIAPLGEIRRASERQG